MADNSDLYEGDPYKQRRYGTPGDDKTRWDGGGGGNFLDKLGMGITGEVQYGPGSGEIGFQNDLVAASRGQGPSAAQAQLQAGKDQAIAAGASMAASARGNAGARAAAQRAAVMGGTQASQVAANQAAVLRAQEQQAAMRTAADYLGNLQQQRTNIAMAEAANKQKAFGAIGNAASMALMSDMRGKENVMPLGGVSMMDSGLVGQERQAPQMGAPRPAAPSGGGGGGGGGIPIVGDLLSDKRAKEALREGLAAGLSAAAGASGASMPTMARAPRMPRPVVGINPHEQAPIVYSTQPVPQVSSAELAARASRVPGVTSISQQAPPRLTGLTPSDERLKTENRELKQQLDQMGRSMVDQISGASDEPEFQKWYAKQAKRWDLDPNPDAPEHYYDYRSAHAVGAGPDRTGHWPSEFKADDHPNRYIDGEDTKLGIPGSPSNTARFPDVESGEADMARKALAPMHAYGFNYKPEAQAAYGMESTPYVGSMAQEHLKSPVYAQTVKEGPDGMLAIDPQRLAMTNTAMIAAQDKRDQEIERDLAELASMMKAKKGLRGKDKQMADLDQIGESASRRASGY